jgi:hypothetical protein
LRPAAGVELHIAAARQQAPLDCGSLHEWDFPESDAPTLLYRTDAGYLVRYPALADFEVAREGCSVHYWPVPGVANDLIPFLYASQVLPFACARRGRLVLHGSAVEVDGAGVAFVGDSGRGKSTLAASFATSGYRFLADDHLIVENDDQVESRIMPAHPSIHLWEDSQLALAGRIARGAASPGGTRKARLSSKNNLVYCPEARPLRWIGFLGAGKSEDLEIRRMSRGDALIELLRNALFLDNDDHPWLAAHFNRLAVVAEGVACYRLDYPRRFSDLQHVRNAIVRHARAGDGLT